MPEDAPTTASSSQAAARGIREFDSGLRPGFEAIPTTSNPNPNPNPDADPGRNPGPAPDLDLMSSTLPVPTATATATATERMEEDGLQHQQQQQQPQSQSQAQPQPQPPLVPLESSLRTTAVHPTIPSIKMPESARTLDPNIHPVTLQPFSETELEKYGFGKLREQISAAAAVAVVAAAGVKTNTNTNTNAGAGSGRRSRSGGPKVVTMTEKQTQEIQRIKDETAALLKQKLDEREAKIRQIEREMAEKEKTREVERKVFQKKFGAGKDL